MESFGRTVWLVQWPVAALVPPLPHCMTAAGNQVYQKSSGAPSKGCSRLAWKTCVNCYGCWQLDIAWSHHGGIFFIPLININMLALPLMCGLGPHYSPVWEWEHTAYTGRARGLSTQDHVIRCVLCLFCLCSWPRAPGVVTAVYCARSSRSTLAHNAVHSAGKTVQLDSSNYNCKL
jgi:hypothetical protein